MTDMTSVDNELEEKAKRQHLTFVTVEYHAKEGKIQQLP